MVNKWSNPYNWHFTHNKRFSTHANYRELFNNKKSKFYKLLVIFIYHSQFYTKKHKWSISGQNSSIGNFA